MPYNGKLNAIDEGHKLTFPAASTQFFCFKIDSRDVYEKTTWCWQCVSFV